MLNDFNCSCPVYIACGYTDLRRGIDGLANQVKSQFQMDPFQRALFLFCGRRRDRLKALYWEGDGFLLLYKRLERGSFQIIQSMSRKGNCYDNCIMEAFFGRMKNEMFYGHEKEYSSFETFAKAVDGYINYYNNERIQEKTKWMPPTKFREASMCT